MSRSPVVDFKGTRRKLAIAPAAIAPGALLLWCLAIWGAGVQPIDSAAPGAPRIYKTNFPLIENPISEGGNWINGQTAGLDWANVRTERGVAFGTESGTIKTAPGKYDDSTALLAGAWSPDQTAQATVHSVHPNDKISEEVELRLRSTLSPHRATGYEINFRCLKSNLAYTEIVRWNGPLGDFTYLARGKGSQFGVANGDVVKASIIGNVIKVYTNGVQVLQATDDTFTAGNPGMGFYIEGASGMNGDYGFTSFAATEGSTIQALATPILSAHD